MAGHAHSKGIEWAVTARALVATFHKTASIPAKIEQPKSLDGLILEMVRHELEAVG